MSRPVFPPLLALLALLVAGILASCANPFADSASTKGPGLNVTSGVGKVTVTWNNVLGASGYRLEWSTSADFAGANVVDPAASPVSIDNTLPGTTYYVRAQANLKSGQSSWSTASAAVTGWTWAPPPKELRKDNFTDTQTLVVDGVTIDVSTSYTVTTVKYETLNYSATGLKRSSFLRSTTKFTDVTGTKVSDTTPVVVTGAWDSGKIWQSFTLGASPSSPITSLTADRTSFILDGVTWTLTP